ncbi:MAG: molybdopterin cofactor-binding domain-containing protein, partial [Pseudomonadota bacterium]
MSEAFTLDPAPSEGAVHFVLNGQAVSVAARPGERLSHTLRECLGSRDVKVGCNAGDCGACTVLLDGAPVCACLIAAQQAEGRTVETLSGLLRELAPVREAFLAHGAAQCGICTPGILVAAAAVLRANPAPDEAAIADGLAGVLCRCTGYRKIIDAIREVTAPTHRVDGAVGEPIPRIDGRPKVDGTEVFGDDVAADALLVRVVRSPHPRARFSFGDLTAYAARHGLVRILTAADVPGRNIFGVIPPFADQPVFAQSETRFRGEAVAAIVGETEAVEAVNLNAFPVVWEPLLAAQTPARALAAPPLHGPRTGNVMCRGFVRRGDAEAALARADVIAEGRFTTPFVEHAYIEPEAGTAFSVDGRIEIHACTQAPVMDQEGVADILGLPREAVRIVPTAAGGGFGSKLDLSVQPYIALAAHLIGRPTRMAYTRAESMQSTTKRHPAEITARIGATRDGTICGFAFEGTFDTGAYASWGPTVATRVPVHASGRNDSQRSCSSRSNTTR